MFPSGAARDLTLVFGDERANAPPRMGHDQDSHEVSLGSTTLRIDRSSGYGYGHPLAEIRTSPWHVWCLGEMYGSNLRSGSDLVQVARDSSVQKELNGHFLLFAWNESTRRWHVWTDRFGTLHCYHACNGRKGALGTYSPAVAKLGSRKELDWIGLTSFFGFGFFGEDRTHFTDVRILRPAHQYVFSEDGRILSQERYWDWWHEPDRTRSYVDTVEAFADVLSSVVSEQTRDGRVALPISGGLDSRATVAALPEDASRPWAFSYGYPGEPVEIRIARRVAEARRLSLFELTIPSYLFDSLDLVSDCLEGFQDVTQCRQAAVLEELSANADRVIAAHWGDVWLDDAGFVGWEGPGRDFVSRLLSKMLKPGRRWLLETVCRDRLVGADPDELLREIVTEEVNRLPAIEDPDFRAKAFKTDQWSFRWTTASLRMFQPAAFPRLPFYDARIADLMCSVSSEFVRGRRLEIDYLKRYAPDLADIPWQATGVNLYRSDSEPWRLATRGVNKTRRLVTRRKVVERNWEVQFLSPEGGAGLKRWLLSPGLRLHDFVAPARVEELLGSLFARRSREEGYAVSMLLTFSAWLERHG